MNDPVSITAELRRELIDFLRGIHLTLPAFKDESDESHRLTKEKAGELAGKLANLQPTFTMTVTSSLPVSFSGVTQVAGDGISGTFTINPSPGT